MNKFQELYSFIKSAVKNHKYAENTAMGHRAALKLFEFQLNENEKDSVALVKKNIEGISSKVFMQNQKRITAQSLNTYKLRVVKVIEDYEKYGINPVKMDSWVSRRRNVTQTADRAGTKDAHKEMGDTVMSMPRNLPGSSNTIDLAIRPGIVISIPKDISMTEAQLIKGVVDTLAKDL